MGYSDQFPSVVRLFELNCCAIPLTTVGSGGNFAAPARSGRWTRFGDAGRRRRRAPHRWTVRNCTSFRFFRGGFFSSRASRKLSADLREESSWKSRQSDGYHTLRRWSALLRGLKDSAESRKAVRCLLAASAEEEQGRSEVFQRRRHGVRIRAAKRSAPSGIAAPPPTRQCQAEFQATMLAHMEEFAGRLAALEVSGVAPLPNTVQFEPFRCWRFLTASRKSSSPALREARTLLGASAVFSRIRLLVKTTGADPPKSDAAPPPTSRPCRSTCKAGFSSGRGPEAHTHWRKSSECIQVWRP